MGNQNSDMDGPTTTFAERLSAARRQAKMSQAAVAKAAGLRSQSQVAMLESGERKGTTRLVAIAAALGVDAQWLADGTGSPTASNATTTIAAQRIADYRDADISALIAAVERLTPEDARALLPVVTRIADSQPRSTARRRGTPIDMEPAEQTPDAAHG